MLNVKAGDVVRYAFPNRRGKPGRSMRATVVGPDRAPEFVRVRANRIHAGTPYVDEFIIHGGAITEIERPA